VGPQLRQKLRLPFGTFRRDETGGTSVIFAITVPAIIGGIVLMTEVGMWRMKKSNLQATADMAALAAAHQYTRAESKPDAKVAAYADALDNYYDPNAGAIVTNIPPITGGFTGQEAVQVTIEQEIPTYMSDMFMRDPVIAKVTAVAKIGGESVEACVLSLAGSGTGISIGGSVDVSTDGCSLHANSTSDPAFRIWGAAEVTAACVSSAGETSVTGSQPPVFTECSSPLSGRNQVDDPYEDLDVPEDIDDEPCQSPTTTGNGNNATMSFPDAAGGIVRLCDNRINLTGEIELEPGTYVIDGSELRFGNSAMITGDDVTLIFMNDAEMSNINGGNGFDLAAPSSGDYAGIAIYADRDTMDPTEWRINGNADMSIYGAIYLPTLDIDYVGGAGTNATGCTQLVANRVSFNGNSGFQNNCDTAGTTSMMGPGTALVVLVE